MVAPPSILSSSATPAQKTLTTSQHQAQQQALSSRPSFEKDGLQLLPGGQAIAPPRPLATPGLSFGARGSSMTAAMGASPGPGSFSVDMRSQLAPSRAGSRADLLAMGPPSSDRMMTMATADSMMDDDGAAAAAAAAQGSDRMMAVLRESLNREVKIKEGSENMLEALNTKKAKQTKEQRTKVEAELNSSSQRIKDLRAQIAELQRAKAAAPATPTRSRMAGLFQSSGVRSPASVSRSGVGSEYDEPSESPTYALAEILQALEMEGLTPDYYVGHANSLVELFKRHPTLKYDLVWSVFGLRMQVMLLSESREVVAAGYRMTRHAISDLSSIQKIRGLNTDYLVMLSLIKERKADVEREQALKLVRAFLEVKEGVRQISRAVVRTIVAVAEHSEDRLQSICIETLAEIVIRDPALLVAAGGMRALTDALGEGLYDGSEGLTAAYLYLLDAPGRRRYLRAGHELEVLFTPFTDSLFSSERLLKQSARAILYALRSWPGIITLSMYNFRAVRSLLSALMMPSPLVKETIIDILFGLLRIKSPSWSSSYLAGRRLTTYGRVTNLKSASHNKPTAGQNNEDESGEKNLIDHYTTVLLAVLITSGMVPALLQVTRETDNPTMKRRTTLLIGETLKLADQLLPPSWSSELQLLPELFAAAADFGNEDRFIATGTVYQIDSVNRTLYRSAPATLMQSVKVSPSASSENVSRFDDVSKPNPNVTIDEPTFRQWLLDSQVPTSGNFQKWNWDIILKIIEGPLLNGKRLEEAIKVSKFVKRIMSFYRPFKYRFAEIYNSRSNQKYVKIGKALMHTLLQTSEGVRYLADNKLLRQIAECLAQCDPTSGLTSSAPMFSQSRLTETLCGGYLTMLGVLSADAKGLQMLDRWRMVNMMYHIIDLKQRPDLIKILLSNFDYSIYGHPRVLLSKALTAGSKEIRIHATNVLRRYTARLRANNISITESKWAIQMLVTQLYDPEVDVCAVAIKILEEACSRKSYLEYIVACRPALDHLGEIGAPLLLRFLSTSIGYHYLDGLDYISNEMDDWFLGRNDAYVGVIEAVLARAFVETPEEEAAAAAMSRASLDDDNVFADAERPGEAQIIPPHFYRELTRTDEGCRLLRDKGHFAEFAATIREHGMQTEDAELMLKVKGCLWAVGNVGSMELGAPFLEESPVVEGVVRIAETHSVLSMRGTAFFVLGLLSRSAHGMEILSECGWDSVASVTTGESLGLCIPDDLRKLFSLQPWRHAAGGAELLDEAETTATTTTTMAASVLLQQKEQEAALAKARTDENPVNKRVLELAMDLGNTVLTKKAYNELMQIKQKKPIGFKKRALFIKVMTLLENHHFRLPVRRVVVDLFDKSVMRQIVLDEESSEEEEEEEDEDDDDEDDDGDERSGGYGSSESGTERQRSISDPSAPAPLSDLQADAGEI